MKLATQPPLTNMMWSVRRQETVTSKLPVETEREKELVQLLEQANYKATRLQDELNQSRDRERQLQAERDHLHEEFVLIDMKQRNS